MTIRDFAQKVRNAVESELKEGCKVELNEVRKNNGVKLQAILIVPEGGTIVPTIYLESFYEAYQEGTTLQEIVNSIIQIYQEGLPKKPIDMEFYSDYQAVKDRICYRLIRRYGNEELLKEIPYIDFLDLAICFYYAYEDDILGEGSILIYHSHSKVWGVSEKQLLDLAIDNTQRLFPEKILTFDEVLGNLKCRENISGTGYPMTILTNSIKNNGAVSMLYPDVLDRFAAELMDSFYIIPSSVHEVIILDKKAVTDPEDVKRTIFEVNRNHMLTEEILSDNLYYYDSEEGTVSIV